MILDRIDYVAPAAVDEAVGLLRATPGSRPLAGGQRLLATLKRHRAQPPLLVDLSRVAELRGVARADGGGLRIGATTTLAEAAEDPRVAAVPVLAEVLAATGDPQLRNRGTVGGAVLAGSTADLPAALLVLDATAEVAGPSGWRRLPLGQLWRRPAGAGEILVAVELPAPGSGAGAYERRADRATLAPVCGVAVQVGLSGGQVVHVRVAVTGATVTPLRLAAVERTLLDRSRWPRDGSAPDAGEAPWLSGPIGADYRRHLAGVLAARAHARAVAAAG